MKLLYKYNNGNYEVQIFDDGTKIRITQDDEFISEFPESIDMKITNYCKMGCPYCHEKSSEDGKHASLDEIVKTLQCLPEGIEIAIGGGNPLDHPSIASICSSLKYMNLIPNITINAKHLKDVSQFITLKELIDADLVYGVGVSYGGEKRNPFPDNKNVVCHLIAGIHSVEEIKSAIKIYGKILILGYKVLGRGEDYYDFKIYSNILDLKRNLPDIIKNNKGIISFDNLAIKQLEVNKFLTKEEWNEFYMGNDGDFTMYYDAVKGEYAKSSTSLDRTKDDISILTFFNRLKENNNA